MIQRPNINAKPICRDKRIFSTGCAGEFLSMEQFGFRERFLTMFTAENTKMNDCYYEKKDWRLCKNEVRKRFWRLLAMIF